MNNLWLTFSIFCPQTRNTRISIMYVRASNDIKFGIYFHLMFGKNYERTALTAVDVMCVCVCVGFFLLFNF